MMLPLQLPQPQPDVVVVPFNRTRAQPSRKEIDAIKEQ
jgi:hypothetical protein